MLTAACTSPSIRIAVTSGADGTAVIYDADLVRIEAHDLGAALGGAQPAGSWLAYDGTSLLAAVATGPGGTIARARLADGSLLERIDFYRGRPFRVYPVFDGESVYALTNDPTEAGDRGTLHVLGYDLAARSDPVALCDASALGLAATRAAEDIFVLCDGDTLVEVDRKLRTRIRVAPVAADSSDTACNATDLAMSSTGTVLFVLCAGTGTLRYLDHLTLEPIDSVRVGTGARRLVRAPDGQHVAVLRPDDLEVVLVDVRRRRITGTVATSQPPTDAAVNSDSRSVFVAMGSADGPGRLLEIAFATGEILADTPTVTAPISVSVWPGDESPVMRWQRRAD